MKMNIRIVRSALLPVILLASAGTVVAGPLNPPAGPVASSYKTLLEVEPRVVINQANTPGDADSVFRITQPGAYYLTSNVAGVAGKRGIEIDSSYVTIDLNGFTLTGVVGAAEGIGSQNGAHHITIRNGCVRQWGTGVSLEAQLAYACTVQGVQVEGNSSGMSVGPSSTVSDCTVSNSTFNGMNVGESTVVRNCTARDNGATGINLGDGATLLDSTSSGNKIAGVSGGIGSMARGVTAMGNAFDGITMSPGSVVSHCDAHMNGQAGIRGINGCLIEHCLARLNGEDGILAGGACTVRFNNCSNNGEAAAGGAGILAQGSDNRIESNNCLQQDRGVHVTGTGNIIIGNTCSGNNANWVIAANNYYGTIINRAGVATPGVNGSAAAGTLATTEPHANFTY